MNEAPRTLSVHIPVLLLSLAISMFFASQIGAAKRSDETIRWQLDNLDKQLTQLKDGQKQLTELIEKRQELVGQSQKVQEQYTALLNDVLDLAKTDDDAAKVVEKWKIQRNTPPEGEAKKDEDKK
jgi:flagellar biosynthesis/type III secretory pathway M-ring protein FliF/YscJ